MQLPYLISLTSVAFFTTSVLARDYFVSPNGSDLSKGTLAEPWQTLSRVNRGDYMPGDRILLGGGNVYRGSLSFDEKDKGNEGLPLLISSYGNGPATIRAQAGPAIELINTGGIHIENLILMGSGMDNNRADGIFIINRRPGNIKLKYIRLRFLDISGFGGRGVFIYGAIERSGFHDVVIKDVQSHDNGYAGIEVAGIFSPTLPGYNHEKLVISRVVAYRNLGKPDLAKHSGNGIVVSSVDGGIIEHCRAYNNGERNTADSAGPVGIWAWDSNGILIQHNESFRNRTGSTKDGGGFDLDGGVTNSIVQFNYSHENDGAGFLVAQFVWARPFYGNVIRNNVSWKDGRKNGYGGIQLWSEVPNKIENSEIYDNIVLASNGSPAVAVVKDSTVNGVYFRQNVFHVSESSPLVVNPAQLANLFFVENVYWTHVTPFVIDYDGHRYSSLGQWQETGQENLDGKKTGREIHTDSRSHYCTPCCVRFHYVRKTRLDKDKC